MNQTDVNFTSNITLGLKSALLGAEVEINRLKDKLNQVALQYYKKFGETELNCLKQTNEFNVIKEKLQQELKDVRNELEQQKRVTANKENDNVNLQFKVKELKSLLDVKVEILESLNIKGDKFDKNTFIDYRTNYKNLLKNLKIILKNSQYYPENQVLDDIRDCVRKSEKGRIFDINKYLRKIKAEKKDQDDITDELASQLEKFDYEPEMKSEITEISPISDDNTKLVSDNIEFKIQIMQDSALVNDCSEIQEKSDTSPIENIHEFSVMSDSDEESDQEVDSFKCSSQNEVHGSPEMPDLVEHVVPVTKECDNVDYSSDTDMPDLNLEKQDQGDNFPNEVVVDCQKFDKLAISLTVEEALKEMHKISKICSDIDVFRTFHDQNKIDLEDCFKKPAPIRPISKCSEKNNKEKKMKNNLIDWDTPVIFEQPSTFSDNFDSTVISTNSSNTELNSTSNCTDNEENLNSVFNWRLDSNPNKNKEPEVSMFNSKEIANSNESTKSDILDLERDNKVRNSVNAVKDSNSVSIFDPEISSVELSSNSDPNNSIDVEMNFEISGKISEKQQNSIFEPLVNLDEELNEVSVNTSINIVDNGNGDEPTNTGNKFVNDLSQSNSNLNFENDKPETIAKSSKNSIKMNSSTKSTSKCKSKLLKSIIKPVNKQNKNYESLFEDPLIFSIANSDKNSNNIESSVRSKTFSDELISKKSVISEKTSSCEQMRSSVKVSSVCSTTQSNMKIASNQEKTIISEKYADLFDYSTSPYNTSATPSETDSESVCVDDIVIPISQPVDKMKSPKNPCFLSNKPINCRTLEHSKFEANEKNTSDLSRISPQHAVNPSTRKRKQKKKYEELARESNNSDVLNEFKMQEYSKENQKPNDSENDENIEKIEEKPRYMNNGMGLRKRGGKYQEIIEQLVSKKRRISDGKFNSSPKTTNGRKRRVKKRRYSDFSEDEERIESPLCKEKEIQSSEISSVSEPVSVIADDLATSDNYENPTKNRSQSPIFSSNILCQEVNNEFDASSTSHLFEEEDVGETNTELRDSEKVAKFIPNDRKEPIHYEPYDTYQNSPNDLINDDLLHIENINVLLNNTANVQATYSDSCKSVCENEVCFSEPICDEKKDVEFCGVDKRITSPKSEYCEEQEPIESIVSEPDNLECPKSSNEDSTVIKVVDDDSDSNDDDSPWSFLFKVDEKSEKIELDPGEMADSSDGFCDDSVTHDDDYDVNTINYCNIGTQTEGLDEFECDNDLTKDSLTDVVVETRTENELVDHLNKSEFENKPAPGSTTLKQDVAENQATVDSQSYSNSEQISPNESVVSSDKSTPEVANYKETLDTKASETLHEKTRPVRTIYDDFVKEKMSQNDESSNEKSCSTFPKPVDRKLKNVRVNQKESENHNLLHIRSDLTFLNSDIPELKPSEDSVEVKNVDEILEEMRNLRKLIKRKNKTLTNFLRKESRMKNDYDCLVLFEFVSSEEETANDAASEIVEHAVVSETKVEIEEKNEHLESDADDESEEEKLIIAEEYCENGADGIEINKFDTKKNDAVENIESTRQLLAHYNSAYCSTLSNGHNSKINMYANNEPVVASRIENVKREVKENGFHDPLVNELTDPKEDSVKLKFYTQAEVKPEVIRLTSFEEVWEVLKTSHWEKPSIMNDEMVWCDQEITRMAFLRSGKPRHQKRYLEYVSDPNKSADLLRFFMRDYEKNPIEAVSNHRMKLIRYPTKEIVLNIFATVMSYANSSVYDMKMYFDRILYLCCALEKDHPDIDSMLLACIRERLFTKIWKNDENLSMVDCMIALSVFYAMIQRKTRNFQPVRDLIYDSLCSLKFRAHPIAYGILSVCPGIFKGEIRDLILTQVILFVLIHHAMERNLMKFRVPEVISIIQKKYELKVGEKAAEDYAKEAMYHIKEETWTDAIFLLCKRQGFSWSYRNVVMKYLLQIVQKWKVEYFDEMILIKTVQTLSKVIQSCPNQISENRPESSASSSQIQVQTLHTYNIELIVKSLSEVLYNPKGSRELHEIMAETICSISHLNFDLCSKILSEWRPLDNLISVSGLQKLNKCMYEGIGRMMWLKLVCPGRYANSKSKKKNSSLNRGKEFIEVGKSKPGKKNTKRTWGKKKKKM